METTVICVDNSEWTRNGDYAPCRFQAQVDAVNLLAGSKTEANAENTVGILLMAGDGPRILTTPTTDLGKILTSMQHVGIMGETTLGRSLQIAQLALKHRQNKLHRQRIVMFVASPIPDDKESLVKLAKRLKKNNVAVDIVSYAAEETNTDKLEAFQEAINSGDNSHLISVPAGTILADSLYSTPLFRGEGSIAQIPGTEGIPEGLEGIGVDPNLDPELALALRVSLEEERARQESLVANAQTPAPAAAGTDAPAGDTAMEDAPVTPANPINTTSAEPMEVDEDALLQQALAMSMAEEMAAADAEAPAQETPAAEPADASMFDEYDEELQNAIRMSMMEDQPSDQQAGPSQDTTNEAAEKKEGPKQ